MQTAILHGILAGFLSSIVIDLSAFRSWKTADEALSYDWRTAIWRWFQGSVTGALTGAGIGGLS